jgi:hypothetical protein
MLPPPMSEDTKNGLRDELTDRGMLKGVREGLGRMEADVCGASY